MKKLIAIFLGIMMISVSAFGISPVQAASLCEGSVTADELNVDRFLSMYDERAEKLRKKLITLSTILSAKREVVGKYIQMDLQAHGWKGRNYMLL